MSVRKAAALEFILLFEALRYVYSTQRELYADARLQKLRAEYARHVNRSA